MQKPQEILDSIKVIQGLMASIATGPKDPEIFEEIQYKDLYESLESFCQNQKLPHKNPFKTLKQWRGYAMTDIQGYAARREYVKSLYSWKENGIDLSGRESSETPKIESTTEKAVYSEDAGRIAPTQVNASNKRTNTGFVSSILEWYHRLRMRPEITVAIITTVGGGFFLLLVTLISIGAKGCQPESAKQTMEVKDSPGSRNTQAGRDYIESQQVYVNPQAGSSLPSADQITALGKRALWSNEYFGSREAYSQLLDWRNSIKDSMTSKLLSAEIKRVEDDYRTDIMRLHIDRWRLIWVPHVDGKDGFVKSEGFLAGNVLAHLSPNRRVDERARAACILRNIKTSPDKDTIDKKELYEKLISHMGDRETSLTVSKMAFETYKDLTEFSSDGVFDFEGAAKDWEKRKDEILKINFLSQE